MVKRKLDVLCRGSYASQSAIEGLLEEVRRNGLLAILSRRSLSRDLAAEVSRETPYGKLVVDITLPLREEGDTIIGVQNPLATLHRACAESKWLARCMRQAFAKHECTHISPWGVVFYADEIGHQPLQHDSRKIECCYWSLPQPGCDVLSQEDAWFIICAVRTDLVEDLPGKMSNLARALKDAVVHVDWARPCQRHLYSLWGDAGPPRPPFAKLGVIIADEKALKELFAHKGASALKFWARCQNVVSHNMLGAANGVYVPSTDLDLTH